MLRIITLNLNYYADKHGTWPARKKLIIDLLREKNPHIVVLQAAARHPLNDEGKDQAQQLAEALDFRTCYFQQAQQQPDGLIQGSAILSRLPVLEYTSLQLRRLPGLDDTNQRVLLRAAFERPGGIFHLYNAHFSWVDKQAALNVQELIHDMKKFDNIPVIVAGDLNTLYSSSSFDPFHRLGMVDAYHKLHGNEGGFTFESDNPTLRIDYFWLSASLVKELNKVERINRTDGNTRLSDHLGLLLELNIRG